MSAFFLVLLPNFIKFSAKISDTLSFFAYNLSKMPILGDIPILGWLFRNTAHTKQKSELVILITPHIVEGDEGVFAGKWVGKERKPLKKGAEAAEKARKPVKE